jgi:hypothetical protein
LEQIMTNDEMAVRHGTSAGALDFRLTIGLKREAGAWTIVHEHHSVPTIEERFTGPGSK